MSAKSSNPELAEFGTRNLSRKGAPFTHFQLRSRYWWYGEITHSFDRIDGVDNGWKNDFAVIGQCYAARRTFKYALTETGFETCNPARKCGLRDFASLRGRKKRSFLSKRLNISQLPKIHEMNLS
jgi:hypothetical protein